MPYPTTNEVKEYSDKVLFSGGHASPEGYESLLADDCEVDIVGRHFSLGGANISGKKVRIDHFVTPYRESRDTGKPASYNVIRVIGGGNDGWYCVETLATGTGKNRMSFIVCYPHEEIAAWH